MVAAHREGRRRFMGRISTARSALDWPSLYLPLLHPERSRADRFLNDFVLCKAEGRKFATHCRLRGWSRATALRWIDWALQIIADALNEDEARRLGS